MRKPGTFAGNDAIVAYANLKSICVVIHQLDTPAFRIEPSDVSSAASRELHLSYHNGEHYSSVRRIGDRTSHPANIKVKVISLTVRIQYIYYILSESMISIIVPRNQLLYRTAFI